MDNNTDVPNKAAPVAIEVAADDFRKAMRELAGAISVITVGNGNNRTGFVATSVSSFSAEPPRIILCISLTSSSWAVLSESNRFGVSFIREGAQGIASRFAGFGGIKGVERYSGADWIDLPSGTQVLKDALVSIDCSVEESLQRHDHAIVIGIVNSIRVCDHGSPLLWFKSKYYKMGGPLE